MFGLSPRGKRKGRMKGNELAVPDQGVRTGMMRIETMNGHPNPIDHPEVEKPVKNHNRLLSKRDPRKGKGSNGRNLSPKRNNFLRRISRSRHADGLSRSLDGDVYSGEVTLATGSTQSTNSGFFRRERRKSERKAELMAQRGTRKSFQFHASASGDGSSRRLSLPSNTQQRAYTGIGSHSLLPEPPLRKPHEVVVAMLESRNKPNMLDVSLVSMDGTKIPTSRYVMACRAEKLERLLYLEGGDTPAEVSLGEYSTTTLNELVDYCFCGELPNSCSKATDESVRGLVTLFELALSLNFEGLRKETFRLTRHVVSQNPALACVVYDCTNEMHEFESYAVQSIEKFPNDTLLDGHKCGVSYLSPERFEDLLNNRALIMDPLTRFQTISRWAEENGRTTKALETAQKFANKIDLVSIDPVSLQGPVAASSLFGSDEINEAIIEQVFNHHSFPNLDLQTLDLHSSYSTDLRDESSGEPMPCGLANGLSRSACPPTPHPVVQALWDSHSKADMLDVSLVGKDGNALKTSRYILASRVEALEPLLYPAHGKKPQEVDLGAYSTATLNGLVEYCFCGEFSDSFQEEAVNESVLDLVELAKLASSLRFRKLGDAVYQLTRRRMNRNPSLACAIFDCAKNLREHESYALQIIEECPNEALLLGDKCGISFIGPERLEVLLTQENMELDEVIVLRTLSRWVEENGKTPASLELARKHAKNIDLRSVSVDHLQGFVGESGLIDQEEISKAIMERMFAQRRKKEVDHLERVEVTGAGAREVNGTYIRKLDRDGQAMFYMDDGAKAICMFQWEGRWGFGPSHDLSNMFYECQMSDETFPSDEMFPDDEPIPNKDHPPRLGWEVSLQGEYPPPKCHWIAGTSPRARPHEEGRLPSCFISEEDLLGN